MATPSQPTAVTKVEKNITDNVLNKVSHLRAMGELHLPKDYSAENSLKYAYLTLTETKDALSCTPESIAQALLKMVLEGLSPMKSQGAFIVYGNKLSWQREYAGNIALARRVAGLKHIKGNAIFKGDEFIYEVGQNGCRHLIKHTQSLESIGAEIIGAYAIFELEDGHKDMEVMNMNQIRAAWEQGQMKGNSPAHKKFPDQMSIKTVINRACKLLINSSDDSHLDNLNDEYQDSTAAEVKQNISDNANKKVITMDITPKEEPKPAEPETPGKDLFDNGQPAEEINPI